MKKPLHFYADPSQAPEYLHTLNKIMVEADAYIILTAEYNRSMPPGLTNLMDHLPPPRLVGQIQTLYRFVFLEERGLNILFSNFQSFKSK